MPPFSLFFALNYPFFALNYLFSASYFLKTAFLLANQNREIFVCILLIFKLRDLYEILESHWFTGVREWPETYDFDALMASFSLSEHYTSFKQ